MDYGQIFRISWLFVVESKLRRAGLAPTRATGVNGYGPPDSQSGASARFATPAQVGLPGAIPVALGTFEGWTLVGVLLGYVWTLCATFAKASYTPRGNETHEAGRLVPVAASTIHNENVCKSSLDNRPLQR